MYLAFASSNYKLFWLSRYIVFLCIHIYIFLKNDGKGSTKQIYHMYVGPCSCSERRTLNFTNFGYIYTATYIQY